MKPIIGITCGWINEKKCRPDLPDPAFDYLKSEYCERTAQAGGIPVILPNLPEFSADESAIAKIIEKLDGIIFSGGRDIDSIIFGEVLEPEVLYLPERDKRRDDFELALAKYAILKTEIPIFGICRGHQLLNVALGGTLYQDIKNFWTTDVPVKIEHRRVPDNDGTKKRVWHSVEIIEETLLARIIGKKQIIVNSSHHQFVRKITDGLVITATAPDNAIESLEMPVRKNFFLTVQWHPEAIDDENSRALFEYFVNITRNL